MATVRHGAASGRILLVSLGAAFLGLAGLGVGLALDLRRALFSYLAAFAYFVSIAVGALFLLMIGYAANARWMSVIRRICETVAMAVVPLGVLFVPIAIGLDRIYVWASPHPEISEHASHLLEHKRAYLNAPFFIGRSFGYFAVWITAVAVLRRWSRRRDRERADGTEPVAALAPERSFSSAMLAPAALATTFACFDWLMSLDPTWFSSIFGIYYFAGGFLGGIAVVSIVAYGGLRSGAMVGVLTANHFHAMGRLLLAFTVFWAYAAYFQLFLIRIVDRPNEVTFYIARMEGGSAPLSVLLALGHFVVPFLLLLPKRWKFRPGFVAGVAVWLLAMHFVDVYWLVLPALEPGGLVPSFLDLAAPLAVGGLSMAFCAFLQRGASLVPTGDPFLAEGVEYASNQ